MKKYIKVIIGMLLFLTNTSCRSNDNKEFPGVKSITDFYGGICTMSYGKSYKNSKSVNFIQLEISKSENLELYKFNLSIPASNIAYIILNELKNKREYDEIRVKIKLKDKEYENQYNSNDIIQILNKKHFFDKIFTLIINEDYGNLYINLDERVKAKLDKESFIKKMVDLDIKYGKPLDVIRHGISIEEKNFNQTKFSFVDMKATIKRKKTSTQISILVDKVTNEILTIKFEW